MKVVIKNKKIPVERALNWHCWLMEKGCTTTIWI